MATPHLYKLPSLQFTSCTISLAESHLLNLIPLTPCYTLIPLTLALQILFTQVSIYSSTKSVSPVNTRSRGSLRAKLPPLACGIHMLWPLPLSTVSSHAWLPWFPTLDPHKQAACLRKLTLAITLFGTLLPSSLAALLFSHRCLFLLTEVSI